LTTPNAREILAGSSHIRFIDGGREQSLFLSRFHQSKIQRRVATVSSGAEHTRRMQRIDSMYPLF